ncbi:hypothetical protein FACS1894182_00030 [Bacteroidia bacterium]|nr:hypothetical protein FACS1894182_00030 [Bacteroidia bacterium]
MSTTGLESAALLERMHRLLDKTRLYDTQHKILFTGDSIVELNHKMKGFDRIASCKILPKQIQNRLIKWIVRQLEEKRIRVKEELQVIRRQLEQEILTLKKIENENNKLHMDLTRSIQRWKEKAGNCTSTADFKDPTEGEVDQLHPNMKILFNMEQCLNVSIQFEEQIRLLISINIHFEDIIFLWQQETALPKEMDYTAGKVIIENQKILDFGREYPIQHTGIINNIYILYRLNTLRWKRI